MKRTLLLLTCVLALTLGAAAQAHLDFADMPLVSNPSPLPNGYGQLDWGNFFYVDPYQWAGSDTGYKNGPVGQDVAFVGWQACRNYREACFGTISDPRGFALVSANVAGGHGPTTVTAVAYRNGSYVGTANYFLTTSMRTVNFPSSWGVVTQVTLEVSGGPGDLVVYSLAVYTLGG